MIAGELLQRVRRAVSPLAWCISSDPWLLARALGWRVTLPFMTRLLPIGTLATAMHKRSPSGVTSGDSRQRTLYVERLLRASRGLVVSRNCLQRSLVAYRFLSEAGVEPTLVMGVRREHGGVDGHAWVEVGGRPLCDQTVDRYSPVVAFCGPGNRCPHSE